MQQEALEAMADKAIERNIGARGLRAVMEGMLTQIMYDIPSDPTIVKVVITKDCVEGTEQPELTHDPDEDQPLRKAEDRRSESAAALRRDAGSRHLKQKQPTERADTRPLSLFHSQKGARPWN